MSGSLGREARSREGGAQSVGLGGLEAGRASGATCPDGHSFVSPATSIESPTLRACVRIRTYLLSLIYLGKCPSLSLSLGVPRLYRLDTFSAKCPRSVHALETRSHSSLGASIFR